MPTDLPPGYTPPKPPVKLTDQQAAWMILGVLALICGTVIAVVWLVTR